MDNLLRHKSSKVCLAAADKLARRRRGLDEKAAEALPDLQTDLTAFVAHVEEMSDAERERYLDDFLREMPSTTGFGRDDRGDVK